MASRFLGTLLTLGIRSVGVVFGAWLMMAPKIIGYADKAAGFNDHLTGPVLLGISFLALWPALRILRWFELPLAAWIFITPFFIEYSVNDNTLPEILHICMALILVGTAFVGGKTRESFGGGWLPILPFLKREAEEEL